jgi:hypothetical protein
MNISEFLDDNESIVWEGKPNRLVYSLRGIAISIFGLFWITPICSFTLFPLLISGIGGLASGSGTGGLVGLGFGSFFSCFTIPFWFIGIAMTLNPVFNFFAWNNVSYAFTDKRIILSSGLIGQDFKAVDFDQIKNITVNVGIIDKLLGKNTGSIKIFSGETKRGEHGTYSVSDTLFAIKDPYNVFRKLKKVSHDIKTDIEYPNKLRPDSNPGYNTKYTPEE